ncbi:MAG TPA: FkbM family methyltransferase [Stellaceae bacterium]|jgi:FkbM family methyltransferase
MANAGLRLTVAAKALAKRYVRALIERASPDLLRSADQQECYSQEGEDIILSRLFFDKPAGFYVDVGAHHPIRHSNTYLLYRRGWRGINIDATPGSMAEFRRLRPRDIGIECLVASDPAPQRFYIFNEPALNTASRYLADERPRENVQFHVMREFDLRPRTLSSLLDEFLPTGRPIDLMSVDVEGLDLDVLRSNDWERYRPEVLLVELLSTELAELDSQETVRFLRDKGYRPIAKLYNTVIFR